MGWKRLLCMVLAFVAVGGGCRKKQPHASRAPSWTGPQWASLHIAARNDDTEAVHSFISHGADVNARDNEGLTPLHIAVRADREIPIKVGQKSVVQLLLAAGADADAADKNGATPLHHAALLGRQKAAKQLLVGGANVKAVDLQGETALHEAAKSSRRELIERLLAKGAEVNAADSDGWTPLHIAAFHGRHEIFDLLMARGANPDSRTREGKTAADLAQEVQGSKAVELSASTGVPYAVIVTDPGEAAQFLLAHAMDFDHVWIPTRGDVEWTQSSLKTVLDAQTPVPTSSWFERDYVIAHFSEYNREYSGFIRRGTRYVICNMYASPAGRNMFVSRDTGNGFTFVADGGGAAVRILFDLERRTVTWMECNGM